MDYHTLTAMMRPCLIAPLKPTPFLAFGSYLHRLVQKWGVHLPIDLHDAFLESLCEKLACKIIELRNAHICELMHMGSDILSSGNQISLINQVIFQAQALVKLLDLQCLFENKLPFHNFFHTIDVATEAALLNQNIHDNTDLLVPRSTIAFLRACYHDLRISYTSRYRRKPGMEEDGSEGLSYLQFKQDFEQLEKDLLKEHNYHLQLSEDFLEESRRSIEFTVARFNPETFEVYNGANLLVDYSDKEYFRYMHQLKELEKQKGRKCMIETAIEDEINRHKNDSEHILKLDRTLNCMATALADISSLFNKTTKWAREETIALFAEEQMEIADLLMRFHNHYSSFNEILQEEKEKYLKAYESFQSWAHHEVHFARGRIDFTYFAIYFPILGTLRAMDMMREGKTPLPSAWNYQVLEIKYQKWKHFKENIESLYFVEGSTGGDKVGMIKRNSIKKAMIYCLELSCEHEDNHKLIELKKMRQSFDTCQLDGSDKEIEKAINRIEMDSRWREFLNDEGTFIQDLSKEEAIKVFAETVNDRTGRDGTLPVGEEFDAFAKKSATLFFFP